MSINNVLHVLRNAKFHESSVEVIIGAMDQLIGVPFHSIILDERDTLLRARPNYDDPRFRCKSDFSYKPAHLNKEFGRASVPGKSVFYGSYLSRKPNDDEIMNARVVGVAESLPLLRDNIEFGIETISFSRWNVKPDEKLYVLSIAHIGDNLKDSEFTKFVRDDYNSMIAEFDEIHKTKFNEFQYFLSNEFSKEVKSNRIEYMISALFTDWVLNQGADGVFYPSVQTQGEGFNVALAPRSMSKLELVAVGEGIIYKNKNRTILRDTAIVEVNDLDEFDMENIETDETEYLERIGITSRSELEQLIAKSNS